MLSGLNHITLAVSDVERSLAFYTQVLGFKGEVKWRFGAYLSLGELWLCLSQDTPCDKDDYTHFALTISQNNFYEFEALLNTQGVQKWKDNSSEGNSLYILDPDGHKLEIHVGNLTSRLASLKVLPYQDMQWL